MANPAPPASRARRVWNWFGARPEGAGEHWLTRFVFLRILGLVYLFAFLSLANQVMPLLGSEGLLPIDRFLGWHSRGLATYAGRPTIFWLHHSDAFVLALAWIGVALSIPLVAGFANAIHLTLLWTIYLSFVHVGQDWFGFGWESQLLETGFLAIFLCPLLDPRPFPARPPPILVIWMLRWLTFRIMFGAGLIKIRGDRAWRDLTALYYHYETQPIPNPLSRILHFAPRWFHQIGCFFNHVVELVAPFFAFGPARARRIAGALFVLFQFLLMLSGNLSFLNLLTVAPCLACFDDGVWRRILPRRLVALADRAKEGAQASRAHERVVLAVTVVVAILSLFPIMNLLSPEQVMNTSFNPLRLVNTYGAFGAIDRERYEIVIEGSDGWEWREYQFKAKPGDPNRRLPVVSPYHYRLDWQMWFAAKSWPRLPAWLAHLVWKLLQGDPGTRSLLANNPFPDAPPKWIRCDLYRYEFTPPFHGASGPWKRTLVRTWAPLLSKKDPQLRAFLHDQGLIDENAPPPW